MPSLLRPAGSTMYPGASSCQHGAAVGQSAGVPGVFPTSTMPLVIGFVVLPGTPGNRLPFDIVAVMNMSGGAGDFDEVTTTLTLPLLVRLSQTALTIVRASGVSP